MLAKLFQCQFLWYGWTNQSIHYIVFCPQKIHNKTFHVQKRKTRLYLNNLESIMWALSGAIRVGHRAMANPTLQLHFGCGRATPPVSHSHKWPSGRMQHFLFKTAQKSYFLPIKTKINFDACMILQKPALLLKGNVFFFLNGQFEGDIIFCHLNSLAPGDLPTASN